MATKNLKVAGSIPYSVAYPTHAAICFQQGEQRQDNRIVMFDNGMATISDTRHVAYWPDGTVKNTHVNFSLLHGHEYKIDTKASVSLEPATPIRINDDGTNLVVENGLLKLQITRPGIIKINDGNDGGFIAVDERDISWSNIQNNSATVNVISRGNHSVTIHLQGDMQSVEKRVAPFIRLNAWLTISAFCPLIKCDFAVTFLEDMNKHGLKQAGLFIPGDITFVGREMLYKSPQKISDDGDVYFLYEDDGVRGTENDYSLRNAYKAMWLNQGPLLDPRLPNDYLRTYEQQGDTTECKPEYARMGNMVGVSMRGECGLVVGVEDLGLVTEWLEAYEVAPIALLNPVDSCATGVMGPIAAAYPSDSPQIGQVDAFVQKALLGWANQSHRYLDYGQFIWGNFHHDELMNEVRPSYHRVWNNNHYQYGSTLFREVFRRGDAGLLPLARRVASNYATVNQVSYDPMTGYTNGSGQQVAGPCIKSHYPGAFYHCKGILPWGGRDWGMDKDDLDIALWGHWPDPSCLLYAWLIDADWWCKASYELWADAISVPGQMPTSGTKREINTTLVHAITLYEFRHDPYIKTCIDGMINSLIAVPLTSQAPGPLWEPTWLSRAYELTKRPDVLTYIQNNLPQVSPGIEGAWTMAMASTSGDSQYITKQLATITNQSLPQLVTDPYDLWQDYGFAPRPSHDSHFMLQWPRLSKALQDKQIKTWQSVPEFGTWLWSVCRYEHQWDAEARGTRILVDVPQGEQELRIRLDGATLGGGDIGAFAFYVFAPDGTLLLKVPRTPMSNGVRNRKWRDSNFNVDREEYAVACPNTDGGQYTILFGGYEVGVYGPLTKWRESQVLQARDSFGTGTGKDKILYRFKVTDGSIKLLTDTPVEIAFVPFGNRDAVHIKATDSQGLLCDKWTWPGQVEEVARFIVREDFDLKVDAWRSAYVQMEILTTELYPLAYERKTP
jgi:hypothetical protein